MDAALLAELNLERMARRACAVVTDLSTGAQRLVREADVAGDSMSDDLARVLRSGKSMRIGEDEFANVHLPPPRIVVIGAAHISQALAPMAAIAGFDLEIIDPRTAFASPERFPATRVHAEWPELVLKDHPLDSYCALVAVTHDPKIDDAPLREALAAGCFYIGALGSRKTHAKRLERLTADGVPEHKLARIEAPIGLDIGASTPAEIAVAILGSVISAFRKRKMHAERRGETEAA